MDIFEYLPQLIVAYDGDDKFANLIHVKKADKNKDYYCPCCGGIVKPRALDSNKEQSHYYHKTGKCTKESQLHFFCKHWLFESGSRFYINDELFEVDSIEIEKMYDTPFGKYKPDITVHTASGKIIYFEMFFTNRKTSDDYFCKWDYLVNDVVEVNVKEYTSKADLTEIPVFKYLYHDGICYSKSYVKRDLYANTIAKIKKELTRQKILNYKARIEQLDWFWQEVQRNSGDSETILNNISKMEYDDMVSCYEIVKRKQCVLYLKQMVLDMINKRVVDDVRQVYDLPNEEDVYFDLEHIRGRTYIAGIRLILRTNHIIFDRVFSSLDNYLDHYDYDIGKLSGYPKIVFDKIIFNKKNISFSEKEVQNLKKKHNHVKDFKEKLFLFEKELSNFEKENPNYIVRINNYSCTVITIDGITKKSLFKNRELEKLSVDEINRKITLEETLIKNNEFLEELFNTDEYNLFISYVKKYMDIGLQFEIEKYHTDFDNRLHFKIYIYGDCVYNERLYCTIEDFNKKVNACEPLINSFVKENNAGLKLVDRINNCKNNFWKASFYYNPISNEKVISIDQKIFDTPFSSYKNIYLEKNEFLKEDILTYRIKKAMCKLLKDIQWYGYRVMEEYINE